MAQPYNIHSKQEDAYLYKAMQEVRNFALESLPLPEGYVYEMWDKIPYDRIFQWHKKTVVNEDDIKYLLKKNPAGNFASIKPDGGLIVAVKKDIGGNIIDWIPMLTSESKHQESGVGNAIERMFKNFNAIKDIFMAHGIFPYLCFGQGIGLKSEFEQNKLRIGMGNDVNVDVNIYDYKVLLLENRQISKKRGLFFLKEEKWEIQEMKDKLIIALKQSYDYFIKNKVLNL